MRARSSLIAAIKVLRGRSLCQIGPFRVVCGLRVSGQIVGADPAARTLEGRGAAALPSTRYIKGTPMKPDVKRALVAIAAATVILTLASLAVPAAPAAAKPAAAKPAPSAASPASSASLDKDTVGGPLMASTGIAVNYPSPGAPKLPQVPVSAYVIADANTGAVLAADDPHGLFPPASTLKVLTAITMLPRLNPNALVKASKLAASAEPNIVGLIAGRRYKVADLFRALLLISANDAAVALVQASGSFSKGMALVNAEAHHLQAYDVVAKQPNGLPAPGQVVSAYDLALIARQALSMPAFMKYDSTLSARFPVTGRDKVTLVNQNYLLTQYKGGLGGKIGWTSKAEATYIGLARRHGVTLIVTILHCTPLQEIYSAEKLLNWGFEMAGHVKPVGALVEPLQPARPRRTASRPRSAAGLTGAAGSLSGATRGSQSGQLLIGGMIAAVLGIGLLGYVLFRRRLQMGKRAAR
jgi:D-alanyl-D-alanine carboxypeptidase (penicillin-binding protein 5/6)